MRNRIHTEFYRTEEEALDRLDQIMPEPFIEGLMVAKAMNHDWMEDGEVYWLVRWVNPWHPIEKEEAS